MANNGVKARQNTQTNNQVFIESANARAMPCHSRANARVIRLRRHFRLTW